MKFLIFLGTVRNSTPPKPARLGVHVANACLAYLCKNHDEHEFDLIDALDYPLEHVFKPHFAYSRSQTPDTLNDLAEKIKSADGYVMISPEYNHSMSPALANLLNHFGSSLFSYKPSAIVTYSAGQWGGMRAAVGMRTYLAELGCLPVSAMIQVPKAQEVFNTDGTCHDTHDMNEWFDYFSRTFNQLIWWAQATSNHRRKIDPEAKMNRFDKNPNQRNPPKT